MFRPHAFLCGPRLRARPVFIQRSGRLELALRYLHQGFISNFTLANNWRFWHLEAEILKRNPIGSFGDGISMFYDVSSFNQEKIGAYFCCWRKFCTWTSSVVAIYASVTRRCHKRNSITFDPINFNSLAYDIHPLSIKHTKQMRLSRNPS